MSFDTMEIVEAELDWETDADSGDVFSFGVRYYNIDINNVLDIFDRDTDRCLDTRTCSDLSHAEAIAEAYERVALRDRKRGETWMGKTPWKTI